MIYDWSDQYFSSSLSRDGAQYYNVHFLGLSISRGFSLESRDNDHEDDTNDDDGVDDDDDDADDDLLPAGRRQVEGEHC